MLVNALAADSMRKKKKIITINPNRNMENWNHVLVKKNILSSAVAVFNVQV